MPGDDYFDRMLDVEDQQLKNRITNIFSCHVGLGVVLGNRKTQEIYSTFLRDTMIPSILKIGPERLAAMFPGDAHGDHTAYTLLNLIPHHGEGGVNHGLYMELLCKLDPDRAADLHHHLRHD